jgi:hypothetical protein
MGFRTVVVPAIAGALVFVTACTGSGGAAEPSASDPAAAPPAATSMAPMASMDPMSPAASGAATVNMFGGPIYDGAPALPATAALIEAGGGAESFSFQAALVSMLGQETVNGEVAKLTAQYGADQVEQFVSGMDYAVNDALRIATARGISLPAPADLHGTDLAKALVEAGTAPDGTFWAGYLFDKTVSHDIHNQVMDDINNGPGAAADMTTHKLLNQAMFDVAQALGLEDVKLASLH